MSEGGFGHIKSTRYINLTIDIAMNSCLVSRCLTDGQWLYYDMELLALIIVCFLSSLCVRIADENINIERYVK